MGQKKELIFRYGVKLKVFNQIFQLPKIYMWNSLFIKITGSTNPFPSGEAYLLEGGLVDPCEFYANFILLVFEENIEKNIAKFRLLTHLIYVNCETDPHAKFG